MARISSENTTARISQMALYHVLGLLLFLTTAYCAPPTCKEIQEKYNNPVNVTEVIKKWNLSPGANNDAQSLQINSVIWITSEENVKFNMDFSHLLLTVHIKKEDAAITFAANDIYTSTVTHQFSEDCITMSMPKFHNGSLMLVCRTLTVPRSVKKDFSLYSACLNYSSTLTPKKPVKIVLLENMASVSGSDNSTVLVQAQTSTSLSPRV